MTLKIDNVTFCVLTTCSWVSWNQFWEKRVAFC